jgi:hypothetical protein
MRLINSRTLELEEFFGKAPPYAILSHTWADGKPGEEVTLQDWSQLDMARQKPGYAKIEGSCRQASDDGIGYVWVDTNCIDKTSSSELSEAINSMFAWYRDSEVCYVYLADVCVPDSTDTDDYGSRHQIDDIMRRSRWFTRGWTLQELVAPRVLHFYSSEWRLLGTRDSRQVLISDITGIDKAYLWSGPRRSLHTASVARRMSWMSARTTTRVEDLAYCLLGIFNINMALLYGEGNKAFMRLQEEIIKVSNDQTIFCWQAGPHDQGQVSRSWISILAPHPAAFQQSGLFIPAPSRSIKTAVVDPYFITNYGLRISLPLIHTASGAWAMLDVINWNHDHSNDSRVLIRLHRVSSVKLEQYVRLSQDLLVTDVSKRLRESRTAIFVDSRNAKGSSTLRIFLLRSSLSSLTSCDDKTLLLTFNVAVAVLNKPLAAVGVEFSAENSSVEICDISGGRGAIILQGYVKGTNPKVEFILFIAGLRHNGQKATRWLVDITFKESTSKDEYEPSKLREIVDGLEEDRFGTWRPSRLLKSVVSWFYSEKGALVCFLELHDIEMLSNQTPSPENDRFLRLRQADATLQTPINLFQR